MFSGEFVKFRTVMIYSALQFTLRRVYREKTNILGMQLSTKLETSYFLFETEGFN